MISLRCFFVLYEQHILTIKKLIFIIRNTRIYPILIGFYEKNYLVHADAFYSIVQFCVLTILSA